MLWQIRYGKPPEDGEWDRHRGHHDENQPPSWQVHISSLERLDQSRLDPASGHLAQISKAAEHSRPRTKFGLLVPGSIDEMRAYIGNGGKGTLESIEDEDLPDFLYAEGDEREDTPDGVCRDENIAGFGYGEKRR